MERTVTFTEKELKRIIEKHALWLRNVKGGERASLRGADLSGASLRGADLSEADLSGASLRVADLSEANLSGASLRGADLSEADLYGANLSGANLRVANLYGASLSGANLSEADLYGADLYGASLSGASLRGANLSEANLSEANLYGASLRGADLYGANLSGASLRVANLSEADLRCPITCPEEGSFIGFKKVRDNLIVKLLIPEDAKRSSATSRKCRCDKAVVLSITNMDGTDANVNEVASKYDEKFIYKVGETVSVNDFCEDRWNECAPGIHFFITRKEAVEY